MEFREPFPSGVSYGLAQNRAPHSPPDCVQDSAISSSCSAPAPEIKEPLKPWSTGIRACYIPASVPTWGANRHTM